MQIAYQILRVLAQSEFVSGESLADSFRITRARVWQAIELLREYGLQISAVKGKGYCLMEKVELLDKEKVGAFLDQAVLQELSQIEILNQTSSTNDYLLRKLNLIQDSHLCVAEGQVRGRGRQGRGWYSPLTKNIAMSYYQRLDISARQAPPLSLVVGISVMQAFEEMLGDGHGFGIKWPNDIWHNDDKLCGILVESQVNEASGGMSIVIGIGINTHDIEMGTTGNTITSIEKVIGKTVSRNQLVAKVVNHLLPNLKLFETKGFKPFMPLWMQYDLLQGRNLSITQADGSEISGQYKGISESGALLMEYAPGLIKPFLSANIKVRPNAVIS